MKSDRHRSSISQTQSIIFHVSRFFNRKRLCASFHRLYNNFNAQRILRRPAPAQLILSEHPAVFIQTFEEDERPARHRHRAERNRILGLVDLAGLHDRRSRMPCPFRHRASAAALYHLIYQSQRRLVVLLDIASHLKDERTLRHLRDLIAKFAVSGGTVVFIDHGDLPPPIRAMAQRFELALPDEKALEELVIQTVRAHKKTTPIRVDLSRQNLRTIVRNLAGLTRRQARQIILDSICTDQCLDAHDINPMLARKRQYLQGEGLLEYVEAPVDLSEIGGMSNLKQWLAQRQCALTDDAAAFGIPPPRGILMLGVQGAGKSLSSKASPPPGSGRCCADPGVLFDRFIGESSAPARRRSSRPR
jgi:hypothetical protein